MDVLVALAAVALTLASVSWAASRMILDPDRFAGRAAGLLEDQRVRSVVAERVTAQVIKGQPDLLAARPAIESVVGGVVGSRPFVSLTERALRDLHRAILEQDAGTVTLTVRDVGTVVRSAVAALRPDLAKELRAVDDLELTRTKVDGVVVAVGDVARNIRIVAIVALALGLLAAAVALVRARDRLRTLFALGVALGASGAVTAIGLIGAGAVLVGRAPEGDGRAAAGALWDAFGQPLTATAWTVGLIGAIVAGAAATPRDVDEAALARRALERLAREPARTSAKLARVAVLVVLGLLFVTEPATVVRALVVLAGIGLLYAGVEAGLRMIRLPAAVEAAGAGAARSDRRRLVRNGAAVVLSTCAVALLVVGFLRVGPVTQAAVPVTGACNGHVELCDRSLTDVALPATHNAMSAGKGWFSTEQDRPIAGQLADGVRGLMIDTHYGDRLQDGKVRTVIDSEDAATSAAAADGVSPETIQAALRLRERLGFKGEGERGIYLCHGFCELGATPLQSVLDDLREFLVLHPEEVIVVINQDEGVPPEAIVKAFRDAGLERYAFTPPAAGEAWPTLRSMIDDDRRLLVMAEHVAGAAPWYVPAYEGLVEETPYAFKTTRELTDPALRAASCKPNRGGEDRPLFLLNHWVTTDPLPKPSDAAVVNARDVLLARARACEQQRDHRLGLVAVNFYRVGDLFGVVDELNGVG